MTVQCDFHVLLDYQAEGDLGTAGFVLLEGQEVQFIILKDFDYPRWNT